MFYDVIATAPESKMAISMEGPLSKWTNVVKGWQYRWFVLDETVGLLSYYTVSLSFFITIKYFLQVHLNRPKVVFGFVTFVVCTFLSVPRSVHYCQQAIKLFNCYVVNYSHSFLYNVNIITPRPPRRVNLFIESKVEIEISRRLYLN